MGRYRTHLQVAGPTSQGASGNSRGAPTNARGGGSSGSHEANFLPPMPKGFQIFAPRLTVAGIQYRIDDAKQFAQGSNQTLALEREPDNAHDPNAFRVVGLWRERRVFIGYVPKAPAEQIVGSGLLESVRARLERIYLGSNGFVDVTFQIVGPKEKKGQYEDFLKGKPVKQAQKNFYKFFGLPIPMGRTTGQAERIIREHRKKPATEDQAKLDAWDAVVDEEDAFDDIRAEFDEAEFRAAYDLKKVSRVVLRDAVSQLKLEGATTRSLADDIDKVVAKVIALKPDAEKQ